MAKHIYLIDGNSIAHANHNGTVLTMGGPAGMQVQAIFGFLRSMKAMLEREAGEPVVLWDGKAQWRLDIYPEYKGNRTQRDPKQEAHHAAFKKQTPIIEKALALLGVKQMRSPLLEADDLAKHLVKAIVVANKLKPQAEHTRITLVSGDKDWLQLVEEGVEWFDPIRDRRVTTVNFFEFTGYMTPAEFVEGKALQGDSSDNIPGIYKLGETTAQNLLARWKSITRFFAEVDAGTYTPATRKSKTATSKHPEELLASPEGRALFERNVKLMDMKHCRKPEQGEMIIQAAPGSREGFLELCGRLSFASMLREQGMFLRHFPNCK